MQILIKLELEDITVRPFGNNFAITPEGGPVDVILLSPEAARELVADLQQLLEEDYRRRFMESGKGYLGQVTRMEERAREEGHNVKPETQS